MCLRLEVCGWMVGGRRAMRRRKIHHFLLSGAISGREHSAPRGLTGEGVRQVLEMLLEWSLYKR